LNGGHEVVVGSSGRTKTSFSGGVDFLTFDRFNPVSIDEQLSAFDYFDIVYDQLAFRVMDVKELINTLKGRTGSYIFTSSAAVYSEKSGLLHEDQFDPYTFEVDEKLSERSYSNGKRNVEAYIYQNADFKVAAARFPSIIGNGDSTLRFQDHLRRIKEGKQFWAPEKTGKRNYSWVDDAGRFLAWLGTNGKIGSYNGASSESFDIKSFLKLMGDAMGKTISFESESKEDKSRYYREEDFILSTEKANAEGFYFTKTEEWINQEIRSYLKDPDLKPNSQEYADSLFP
jgi:nucleoside-diphosphate-sugar epimerase